MVIGNGMIAKAFESYRDEEGFIIFASGVSDSVNVNTEAFEREIKLIKNTIETHKDKLLVYFSTCSIYDDSMQDSAYVQHKIKAEKIIMEHYAPFIIFRLTNPIGKTQNTRTLVNFSLRTSLKKVNLPFGKMPAGILLISITCSLSVMKFYSKSYS
ncbi:MAG: hypothetical protein IPL50_18285 [Chitinophagaceae bacterium]|nr:hypothetical protein [Chitinophagaceae bacterium]